MKFRTSDGIDLHVTIKGKGMPCVYMHGGPGSGAFWLEYFSGEMLEKNFRMIYVDQRGVSRSTGSEKDDYSLERQLLDFEELRKGMGIEQWFTLGHSFGGIFQIAYAEKYPEAVKGMVMVNCTLNLNESIESMIKFATGELEVQDTAPFFDQEKYPLDRVMPLMGMMREKGVFWKFHYGEEKNYYLMDSVMNLVPNWNWIFSNKGLSLGDYYKNFKPVAPGVQVPVLFFYGTRDYAVGPEHYRDVHFPEMMLWKFHGGHVPFMEGEEDLEKAISKYLKKYRKQLKPGR